MELIALGLNHRTAPVQVREQFSLSNDTIRQILENLSEYEPIQEAVILSTCNRSELYVAADGDAEKVQAAAQRFLTDAVAGFSSFADYEQYVYTYTNEECINHLLRVASSLDSLVLGEGQILSQVKHAYALAKDAGSTSTVLNLLFHRAITAGKRVRTETRIAYNAVSISYAAVELARSIFSDLSLCRVMLIGAGKMAELTATHMVSKGVKKLCVANRHIKKAQELAERYRGKAVSLTNAFSQVQDADIIVTSTGASDYVIRPREMAPLMAKRSHKPLVLIDIAVPRDVDPEVADIPGITLYNIDDLENVVDENKHERQQEAQMAETIVESEAQLLIDRYRYLPFQPILASLSEKAEEIRSREVKRAMSKLPEMDEAQLHALNNMTHMIVRKILREPMVKVTESAGQPYESFLVRAMASLFQLDASIDLPEGDESTLTGNADAVHNRAGKP